ncbi:MAG TPA: PilC/PilY family type IV pilus protein, partial [Burkholderiales bacterium]|nr:PilC/PilY family type IV pilus protein [Burkholderiales bacterium]
IDDLAHAAINSRGAFFSASDPDELATSLSAALENISARGSAGAPVGMGTANVVLGDNTMFASSYLPGLTWTGELGAYAMDLKTGAPSNVPLWLAQGQLDARAPESRFIASYSGMAGPGQGIRFQPTASAAATKLSAAQQALLNTPVSPPGLNDGAAVVEYLRGKRTREGDGTYRTRVHLLGDIVNAQPVVVRPPHFQYADAGYAAFKTAHANRRQIVLQGANDGMMHAFDAGTALVGGVLGTPGTGAELWAYVPSLVFPTLNNLSRRLGYTHKYYVDGTPVVGDVDFNKTSGAAGAPDWRTIAVGGLGKGGRGVYALDVTDTLAVDEAAVASKVLWEFPNSATNATIKANIGYTFGKPIITKTRAHGWVVLVTSGHNNGSDSGGDGKGYLFVLNARTGEVIRAIGTGIGSAATPNGLSYISAYAESATIDNTVDHVYGGDLMGNVWRFNLTDPVASANWNVKVLATLVDAGGIVQPVTTEPELAKIKINGIDRRFVYVGTGLLLGDKDIPGAVGANPSATGTQSLYGLIDDLSEPAGVTPVITPLRASLQQQTLTSADAGITRTASNNAIDFAVKKGWYVDLPVVGERINTPPALAAASLVFVSNVPSADPCTLGGVSYFNVLDYQTGGFRAGSPVVGVGDGAAKSSVRFDSMASGVILARLMSGTVVGATQLWDGNIAITTVPTGSTAAVTRRRSWRELLQ